MLRSICGPVALDAAVPSLSVTDSIVTSGPASGYAQPAITAVGAMLRSESATVFGRTHCRILEASNCIFTGVVQAERRQTEGLQEIGAGDRAYRPQRAAHRHSQSIGQRNHED